jgi:DNA-binding beta-propeller fold protein YncE
MFIATGPQLFLLYSDGEKVRRQTLDHADNFDIFLPLDVHHKVKALEYDPTTDMIYWIDAYDDEASIYRSFSNGTKMESVATSSHKETLTTPLDIALDPYGKQLYWTDDVSRNIKVTSLTSDEVGTLVSSENGEPKSIALDPKRG